MKKVFITLGLGALLFAGACSGNDQKKIDEDSVRIADLTKEYNEATSFNDSLMLLMGDIYTGLDSINMQEGLLYNIQRGEGEDRRAEVRHNLNAIRARLNANKALLAKMEQQAKASGNENAVLTKTINQLKAHIEQQDQKITQLESDLATAKGQIEELNTQVAAKTEEVATETAAKEEAQQAAIAAANEANTVYYAIGTNKELKQNGLLEKKFLGATKVLKGDFNASYFHKADKRNFSTIPTGAKKVKIWSNMPENSYQIVENPDGTKTIKVLNPDLFWSRASHLIIQID